MNLRFPGQYYDQETGTHYNYYRDYKPSAGRYVQSDPIGLEGGVNMYSYVENNPFSDTDVFGLRPSGMGGRSADIIGAMGNAIDHGICGWWPNKPEFQGRFCVLWRCAEKLECGRVVEWEYGRGVSNIVPLDYNPNKDSRCRCVIYCAAGKPNCIGVGVE